MLVKFYQIYKLLVLLEKKHQMCLFLFSTECTRFDILVLLLKVYKVRLYNEIVKIDRVTLNEFDCKIQTQIELPNLENSLLFYSHIVLLYINLLNLVNFILDLQSKYTCFVTDDVDDFISHATKYNLLNFSIKTVPSFDNIFCTSNFYTSLFIDALHLYFKGDQMYAFFLEKLFLKINFNFTN